MCVHGRFSNIQSHIQVLDHMMLQPRRLPEVHDTSMNSKNEFKANPGQTSNIYRQHSKNHFYSPEVFQRSPRNVHSFIHSAP